MKSIRLTRRQFTKSAVAAGAFAVAPALARGRNLNDKLNIAIVGVAGRGGANLDGVKKENITALCDVDAKLLDAAGGKFSQAKKFNDVRKLFDNASDFDAVVVSTPEHTHAFATMLGLKHGKHVYCEKPLTHDIWEARQIREAAATAKVATQMGIQIHALDNFRRVVEAIRADAIGPVREVHVWVDRARGLQSEEAAKRNKDQVYVTERPTKSDPIPTGLNWDAWLGPAPERPFNSVYLPGPKWYRWWDFGNGTMSDLGSHWNDLPFWALDLKAPLTIEPAGPPPHPELAPATMSATYEYAARDEKPPVKLTWYQGEIKPAIWTTRGVPQWPNGCLFVGEKGMLLSDYYKHVLLPEKEFADFKRPEKSIPASLGHHQEWINACKTGEPTTCNFEYAGWLTEANHLGNVAYRTGKKLVWDPTAMRATNAPEADQFIRREYRKGWTM